MAACSTTLEPQFHCVNNFSLKYHKLQKKTKKKFDSKESYNVLEAT